MISWFEAKIHKARAWKWLGRRRDNLWDFLIWEENDSAKATRFETCSAKLNSNDTRGTHAQYTGSILRHVDYLQHYSNWAGNRLRLHAFNSNWPVLLPALSLASKSIEVSSCWMLTNSNGPSLRSNPDLFNNLIWIKITLIWIKTTFPRIGAPSPGLPGPPPLPSLCNWVEGNPNSTGTGTLRGEKTKNACDESPILHLEAPPVCQTGGANPVRMVCLRVLFL